MSSVIETETEGSMHDSAEAYFGVHAQYFDKKTSKYSRVFHGLVMCCPEKQHLGRPQTPEFETPSKFEGD